MPPIRTRATQLCLLLGLSFGSTPGLPILVRAHALSVAAGRTVPSGNKRFLNSFDFRFLDLAIGPRIGEKWALLVSGTLAEYPADYTRSSEPFFMATALGVSAIYGPSLVENPRGLVASASIRGSNGWGLIYPAARYLEVDVDAGLTLWALSPTVEIGWRHEFAPRWGTEPPSSRTTHGEVVRFSVRMALGGTYEIRVPWLPG